MGTTNGTNASPPRLRQAEGEEQRAAQLRALGALQERLSFLTQLGISYGGSRDIYDALGWPKVLTFEHYWGRATRQDLAAAVVWKPVRKCWSLRPRVHDADGATGAFAQAVADLDERLGLFADLERLDGLARIGRYAALFLGFDDGGRPDQPVERATRVLYTTPLTEAQAEIAAIETEPTSERFGMARSYNVSFDAGSTSQAVKSFSAIVHPSRVLHVAHGRTSSRVYGTPALQPVYNMLASIELTAGGDAEGHWRGSFPGFNAAMPADAQRLLPQEEDDLVDEIEEYVHGYRRYMLTRGIQVQSLAQQVADPTGLANFLLKLVAAGAEIPLRILLGSEAGQLASDQDERAWLADCQRRRDQVLTPTILRPLISQFVRLGTLPKPKGTVTVEWPPLVEVDPEKQATRAKALTEAMRLYLEAGADVLIPPDLFLTWYLGLNQDQLMVLQKALEEYSAQANGSEPAPAGPPGERTGALGNRVLDLRGGAA